MPLSHLSHSLNSKGFISIHDEDSVIAKVIHDLDEKYHAFFKHRDGHIHIEVLKKDKTSRYTADEYQDCKRHKANLIEKLNQSGIGFTFDRFGITKLS